MPNPIRPIGGPRTHRIIRIDLAAPNHRRHEISPSFTHPTALPPPQTSRIGRTAGQADAQPMRQLVNHDTRLEVAIAVRIGRVPDVHPTPARLTVGRRHEIRIVVARTVLRVGDHRVVLFTPPSEIVRLKVARHLVKAVSREKRENHKKPTKNGDRKRFTGNRDREPC
jgi:hypothetical protein